MDPGDDFVPSERVAVLRQIPGLVYTGTEITSPAVTIETTPLQVIRSPLALVVASNSTGEGISDPSSPDDYGS